MINSPNDEEVVVNIDNKINYEYNPYKYIDDSGNSNIVNNDVDDYLFDLENQIKKEDSNEQYTQTEEQPDLFDVFCDYIGITTLVNNIKDNLPSHEEIKNKIKSSYLYQLLNFLF